MDVMKTIYKLRISIYILFLMATMQVSCEKFLTMDSPTGVTDEQWWNTETDANNALNSAYAGIPGGSSGRNIMYYSGMTDEAVQRGEFKGYYDAFTRGLANSRWTVSQSLWQDDYICIRRTNRFLENVDRVFFSRLDLKPRMILEARALRAYYHMELMMLYGDIPLLTQSLTPAENNQPRTPENQVYDFIVKELTDCAEQLPATYDNADRTRITSGVCWALLSRLGLYKKDYELAKTAAKKIIDSKVYKLWRNESNVEASYRELFSYPGELNQERIFFKENGASNAWTTFAPFGLGGEAYLSPTNTVVDNWELRDGRTLTELDAATQAVYRKEPNYENNRDPRLSASVFVPNEKFEGYTLDPFYNPADKIGLNKSTATGFWVKKYVDARDRQSRSGNLDFMIIRYAEILLTYAEAMIELGQWNDQEVLDAINEVRSRATMPDVDVEKYNSQVRMRELIRRERQAELAFEGGRYFDIRRWGIDEQVMNGQVYGATNPATGEITRVQTRTYSRDREYLWPIPETEMSTNPNMVQNPNY